MVYLYLEKCLIEQAFKIRMGSILMLQTTNQSIHQSIITQYICYQRQSTETIQEPFY